ncbi:MAG: BrnT family toxin [Candidatus Riflebacteria bacterium]|nr:BrnT family toxin [Candidatus Riflebacteria bacterium]
MVKTFHYEFEWDPSKARKNLKKHGVPFERAATIFLDSSALSELDEEHSQEEERWLTLGLDKTGILLVVSHTYMGKNGAKALIRLISARKATKTEAKQYEGK